MGRKKRKNANPCSVRYSSAVACLWRVSACLGLWPKLCFRRPEAVLYLHSPEGSDGGEINQQSVYPCQGNFRIGYFHCWDRLVPDFFRILIFNSSSAMSIIFSRALFFNKASSKALCKAFNYWLSFSDLCCFFPQAWIYAKLLLPYPYSVCLQISLPNLKSDQIQYICLWKNPISSIACFTIDL